MTEIENENIKAFNKLLAQKELEEKGRLGSYHYWKDLYGNKYGWYVARQADGKFHAFILKVHTGKKKIRVFARKKLARAWAYKNYKLHYDRQVAARKSRQEKAEARRPVFTEEEKKIIACKTKLGHFMDLIAKNQSKMKCLLSRTRTYKKRLKYYTNKLDLLAKTKLEVKASN